MGRMASDLSSREAWLKAQQRAAFRSFCAALPVRTQLMIGVSHGAMTLAVISSGGDF